MTDGSAAGVAMFVGWLCGAMATAYMLIALLAVRLRRADVSANPVDPQPVSVLKPLCGAEPHLYECLKSLCDQDFPEFQIIFGVSDPSDPALGVVRRLQDEFPRVDIRLSTAAQQRGSNRKVSNLRNMLPLADHNHLVLADSDILVPPDYLSKVTAPLNDQIVGIVTCAYSGHAERGLWSCIGALFINDWFMPAARVAALFGSREFAFGATIALRRDTLTSIGGFAAIADQLADDYRLGELTRDLGLRTVLSDCIVQTRVNQPTLATMVQHQLRWLRTIRSVRPLGYAFAFVSFSVPVTLLGYALTTFSSAFLMMLEIALLSRACLHLQVRPGARTPLPLVLLSDFLTFGLWCWAVFVQHIHWRGVRYRVVDRTFHV
jgi:ceramide glucosyltransferase